MSQLGEAQALGESLAGLFDVAGTGVIRLDQTRRIVDANDYAVELLRHGNGLIDKGGVLHALAPEDDAALQRLLERALPRFSGQGAADSMTVGRQLALPRLVLRVIPVGHRSTDLRTRPVAGLVLVIDPAHRRHIDTALVASALGLTPAESAVAVMLAAGDSLQEIAAATRRKERTIRWHLLRIFAKLRISRQADLVRLVLSVSNVPMSQR